jgi:hypothetical protein
MPPIMLPQFCWLSQLLKCETISLDDMPAISGSGDYLLCAFSQVSEGHDPSILRKNDYRYFSFPKSMLVWSRSGFCLDNTLTILKFRVENSTSVGGESTTGYDKANTRSLPSLGCKCCYSKNMKDGFLHLISELNWSIGTVVLSKCFYEAWFLCLCEPMTKHWRFVFGFTYLVEYTTPLVVQQIQLLELKYIVCFFI